MVKKINSDEDLKIYENEKHFKVFAGPGAGKTYLIIENIKHIIQNSKKIDKDFRKILCITYTNIAVDEISKRLASYNQYAYVSTIHSFLYQNIIKVFQKQLKIIINEMYEIDIPDNVEMKIRREGESIISNETVDLIKNWIKGKTPIDDIILDKLNKNVMMNCVLALADKNKYPFNDNEEIPFFTDVKDKWLPKELRLLIKKYLWAVQGVLDFDEILYFSLKLIKKYSFVKYDLKYKFPYIFVDEQQDINPIQYEIIRLIFDSEDVTVGFVGDLAQSIYSFQGADYTMLDSAKFDSKEQDEYVIEGNRRSTENIINFCNYVRKNDNRLAKQTCKLNVESNQKVKIIVFTDKMIEINNYVDEDTIVLCRKFVDLFGYIDIIDQEQKEAVMNLYRNYTYTHKRDLLNDFTDENYEWIKAIKFLCRIDLGIRTNNFPIILNEFKKHLNLDNLLKENKEQINYYKAFYTLINKIKEIIEQVNKKFITIISEIDKAFEESMFDYNRKIYENDEDNPELCSEILDIFTLKTALEIGNKIFISNSKYKTIHRSKGKEYDKVLVDLRPSAANAECTITTIDMLLNPIIYSDDEKNKQISEFVRIFYVGISRAINELTIVLEGNTEQANQLDKKLKQYMNDEHIIDEFYEMIIL